MAIATLTSKGQVTIPASVRSRLGLRSGDRIEFIQTGEGVFTIVAATNSVTALKGIVKRPPVPVSIEDMKATIAEAGAGKR